MKKITLAVLLMISQLTACNPSSMGNNRLNDSAIVGGTEVDPLKTDTSYIVNIGGNGCAGMIISPTWILTAAHCETIFNSRITAGGIDLKNPDRILLTIKRFIVHPKFSLETATHDFALLELDGPIDFEETKLSAIKLADPDFAAHGGIDEGVMATAYGWGLMHDYDMKPPTTMREVTIPIVSRLRANAEDSYNNTIDESMLPAGLPEGGKDSCSGDSGGPLVVTDSQTNEKRLVGVVSFGEGCAAPKMYGIYSNVAYAYPWIMGIIN